MSHQSHHGKATALSRTILGSMLASLLVAAPQVMAAPHYEIGRVLVAEDQYQGEAGMVPKPLFKPHDARTSLLPRYWIASNERTGCAGITVFENGSDRVRARLFIDDPGAAFPPDETSSAAPCVGSVEEAPPTELPEPPEGTPPGPEDQFVPELRFNPTLCLPVVLPPGQDKVQFDVEVIGGGRAKGTVKSPAAGLVCAPLGAEKHARHPHGITIDHLRQVAYQVIEHSGLRWNAKRTAFEVAMTTDEESGMTLAYDLRDPSKPRILKAYLNGHGAHEVVVNPVNGLVFQGNHEDSHGVTPSIWVDVINPAARNPYGFIDTGFFNAIQGIDVADGGKTVYGVTHVGEKLFALRGDCRPTVNPAGAIAPPPPPGHALPDAAIAMKMGWNCIKWWVDLRPAFTAQTGLGELIDPNVDPAAGKPQVLHFHNLASTFLDDRAYMTLHSIHDAEHTGLAEDEPPPTASEEEETEEHFMGRWVAQVGAPDWINSATKQARAPVRIIDLSNGFPVTEFPDAEAVQEQKGLDGLLNSFVHAHFIALDPLRNALLVTGEHTGNLGVVDLRSGKLERVIPISRKIPGCIEPAPEDPTVPPTPEEPHVHGVTVQPLLGTLYVSDEGEHCFYESATLLKPW